MNTTKLTDAIVIPKDYIAFSSIAFVCGAVSKDETRQVLHFMEVKRDGLKTTFVATDGRRLHFAELDPGLFDDDIDQLDPGLYELISKSTKNLVIRKSDGVWNYPNWRQLFDDKEPGDNLAEVCEIADSGKIGEVMIRTDKLIDTAFLESALGYKTSRKTQDHCSINFESVGDPKTGPVMISHDHGTALLMPMRREEPEPGLEDQATYSTAPIEALKESLGEGDSLSVEVDGEKVLEISGNNEASNGGEEEE